MTTLDTDLLSAGLGKVGDYEWASFDAGNNMDDAVTTAKSFLDDSTSDTDSGQMQSVMLSVTQATAHFGIASGVDQSINKAAQTLSQKIGG